jgi:hypothetical protein
VLPEDEDCGTLVIEDDGKMYVEHERSHINAYKFRVCSWGKTGIAVNHFLSKDYNSKSQLKFREELSRSKGTT